MVKGDIVLISFPFTDLSSSKLRPAVVLVASSLDLTVCFMTTQTAWLEEPDLLILPNNINGLRKTSLIKTRKIATLDRSLAKGLLGKLSKNEIKTLNEKLKTLFQLP